MAIISIRQRSIAPSSWRKAAVRLDPRVPPARAQLGFVLLFKRRHDESIAEFERGFALNPNFIDYRFGNAVMYVGEPEVLEAGTRSIRFSRPTPSVQWVSSI